jgi:glycosyltransferase involved in cell wall biosynthesis
MIEAMSQSRPVIATRVGGMATAIENGENGILVSPEDPQAIAKAVKRVACNRDLVRKLTRNALKFAAAHSVEREMGRIAGIVYSSYNARKMGARSIYHA